MTDPAVVRHSPMFPLGSVLLPTMTVPLHVFEDRYRRLVHDVLDGDGTFGVTMIERGSEVGGGDVRAAVGCVARVVEAEEQPDGRWFVLAVGTDRLVVDRWLPDEPYPRAEIRTLADEPDAGPADAIAAAAIESGFRELMASAAPLLGDAAPPSVELSPDPTVAAYQMGALAPIGVLDRYRLLAARTPAARAEVLVDAFETARILVEEARGH